MCAINGLDIHTSSRGFINFTILDGMRTLQILSDKTVATDVSIQQKQIEQLLS